MIYYVSTGLFSHTIDNFLQGGGPEFQAVLRPLSYEELFFERAGPIGHYIFTDFDRLSRFEIEAAARFVRALREVAPAARILNNPVRAMERVPLLVALNRAGINDFTAHRIDTGVRPDRYPVFIRAEDGHRGPQTPILNNDAEYDAALADLALRGLTERGRIAVGYQAEADEKGQYRKYGAFSVGGIIVPQHLLRSRDWSVKRASSGQSAEEAEEELRFVRDNPHRDVLRRAFTIGHLDFGRADYGVVGGRVQIYEINTNPTFPHFDSVDQRAERRGLIREAMVSAFRAIDVPLAPSGRVRYREAPYREIALRLPRRRLLKSVSRRLGDLIVKPPKH